MYIFCLYFTFTRTHSNTSTVLYNDLSFSLPPSLSLVVINKGQCVTKYYRWIQKNGGYIWIQSSATISFNAKNANEKNIIWVNYVLR